jgi:hypothetical protein
MLLCELIVHKLFTANAPTVRKSTRNDTPNTILPIFPTINVGFHSQLIKIPTNHTIVMILVMAKNLWTSKGFLFYSVDILVWRIRIKIWERSFVATPVSFCPSCVNFP